MVSLADLLSVIALIFRFTFPAVISHSWSLMPMAESIAVARLSSSAAKVLTTLLLILFERHSIGAQLPFLIFTTKRMYPPALSVPSFRLRCAASL